MIDAYIHFFVSARNGVFVGVIFVGAGIWLSKENNPIKKWSFRKVLIALAILYTILMFETIITYGKQGIDDSSLFIVSPLISVLLMELAIRIKCPYGQAVSFYFRRLSGNLYFTHSAVISYIGTFIFGEIDNDFLKYTITVLICLFIWMVTKNCKRGFVRKVLP